MSENRDSTEAANGPLTVFRKLARLAVIGAVLLIVVAAFVYVGGGLSPSRLTQARIIAALEASGTRPGFRRNHAKGLCFSGYFTSQGEAVPWSKAALFARGQVPVIGRFALAGGMPFQADTPGGVRSVALRFALKDGTEWRTGMNAMPVFPVNTAAGFYDQVAASIPDPDTGKPSPAAMQAFLNRHPEAVRAIALIRAYKPTAGFADSTFNSLDAFLLINAGGVSVPVRWALTPMQVAVVQASSPDDDAPTAPAKNYLFEDLVAQLHEHKLQWRLILTLGRPGDATDDATLPWPDDRRRIDAGVLTVDHLASEDGGPCTDINFDPLVLPPGIEPSDDPLLSARSAVYARSFALRAGERSAKAPSAIAPGDVLRVTP